jgi:hypothetical protein
MDWKDQRDNHLGVGSLSLMRSRVSQPELYIYRATAAAARKLTPTMRSVNRNRLFDTDDHRQRARQEVSGSSEENFMKRKPSLSAVGYMESDWIRYAIQDERGRNWTGRGFTNDKHKALAYADETVIARDMRRILKRRCKGLIRYRFVASLTIDVYAEGPIDHEEMAWFFSQNCFVSMDGLGTGVGPDESVVLPLVGWNSLRLMKGQS